MREYYISFIDKGVQATKVDDFNSAQKKWLDALIDDGRFLTAMSDPTDPDSNKFISLIQPAEMVILIAKLWTKQCGHFNLGRALNNIDGYFLESEYEMNAA